MSYDQLEQVFVKLLEIECLETTASSVVETEKFSEYDLSFRASSSDHFRSFHVSMGKSFLLVSLPGETDLIIKHEISIEDYNTIKTLLENITKDVE